MNLGGRLIWISLMECMDHVRCVGKVFGQFPVHGVEGVVKPSPLDEVKQSGPPATAVNLLLRIQLTSHSSESSSSIGGNG